MRAVAVILSLLMVAAPSLGQTVSVPIDPAFPSGGSGAPLVFSGEGLVDLVLDTSDPGPVPLSLVDPTGTKTPAATLTFTGMTQTPSLDGGFTYKPPDTPHAVGTGAGSAGRVVHVTNSGVRIFDKTGASVAGPLDLDAFLTALGASGLSGIGSANLGFDPKVIFDQHSGRFFIVILDGRTPGVRSNVQICISKTATPGTLTTTDWTVETASALTTFAGGAAWFDYPGLGADATRLVVTGNMFSLGGFFLGTKVRVFLKSSLTDNGSPGGVTFNDIDVDASVTSGIFTAQPAHVFGATLNGDFYLVSRLGPTAYRQWQITGAGGAATLVAGSPSLHAWTAGGNDADWGTRIPRLGAFNPPPSGDPFTDDPLVAGTTEIKAVHFTELRDRIDVQLVRFALPAHSYTNVVSAGATIQALDVTEMYTAANLALVAAGQSAITVPTITPGTTIAIVPHIENLRAAVLTLEALP